MIYDHQEWETRYFSLHLQLIFILHSHFINYPLRQLLQSLLIYFIVRRLR